MLLFDRLSVPAGQHHPSTTGISELQRVMSCVTISDPAVVTLCTSIRVYILEIIKLSS